MSSQKMTVIEQIRDYYLLGVYLMEKEQQLGMGDEKSTILDHLDKLRLRCLYLGLSGEYLLKSFLVKNGYSIKNIGKKKIMSKPAEEISSNDYVVGYEEMISTLKNANIAQSGIPILKILQAWRNSTLHKFYLENITEQELENAKRLLIELELHINPNLELSTSIFIKVNLDFRETNGGVRILTVNVQDNMTDREIELQELFDIEQYFGNMYVNGPDKKRIESHVVRRLKKAGYLFKQRNFEIEVDEEDIEKFEEGQ